MPGSNEYSMGPEDSRELVTPKVNTPPTKTSPFYQERDFRQTKLQEMYGDNPTKRQMRKFNRYANSEQGRADETAFVRGEIKNYLASVDAYANNALDRIRNANKDLSLKPKSPVQPSAPVVSKPSSPISENDDKIPTQPVAPTDPVEPTTPITVIKTPQNNPFDINAFAFDNKLRTKVINGKTYARYDPWGSGDYWIGEDGTPYMAGMFGALGAPVTKWIDSYKGKAGYDSQVKHNTNVLNAINNMITGYKPSQAYLGNSQKQSEYANWEKQYRLDNPIPSSLAGGQEWGVKFAQARKAAGFKQGGIMNRINYFQQGGAAPQQDMQQQDMQQQIVALVQAAMQGDQKATQTVNQIMEAAKAGDQQAVQLAQMIQQVAQQMQGQAVSAKYGNKLAYLKELKCGGKAMKKKTKGSKGTKLTNVMTPKSCPVCGK